MEFLMPIDNLENALKHTGNLSEELKNWAYGFKMILNQFKEVLENQGIVPYDSIGKHFDPHLHEAMETIETDDFEEGIIIEEIVKGYKCNKKILRVARVKVSKKPSMQEKDTISKNNENIKGD